MTTCTAPTTSFANTRIARYVDNRVDSIKTGIAPPRPEPRHKVGDWIYDWYHRMNVQVLSVQWHSYDGWLVSTAGHGGRECDFHAPHADVKWVVYALMGPGGHSWDKVSEHDEKPDDILPHDRPCITR